MIEDLQAFWNEAVTIWLSGGWAMPFIAGTAFVMFALGMQVLLKLRGTGYRAVSENTWRYWIDHPALREGPLGERLDAVAGATSLKESAALFEDLRATEVAPFERDLKVMKVCVGVAPLLGLLGTVTGMLSTFDALSTGSGGEKTMGLIAEGISVALVTTETGLVIALAGLFFQYQLSRKFDYYKAFLAHLETACAQNLYRKLRKMELQQKLRERDGRGAAA